MQGFVHRLNVGLATMRSNFVTGVRASLPLRWEPPRRAPGLAPFIALLSTLFFLSAADDFASAGRGAEFVTWGLHSWFAVSYCWLASLAVIVALERQADRFLAIATPMASALLFQQLVWIALERGANAVDIAAYGRYGEQLWWGFLVWEITVFGRIVVNTCLPTLARVSGYLGLYALVAYYSLNELPHSALFTEPYEPRGESRIDVESTYYAQSNLIAQNLYALSPQRAGTADVYFIGFGAYAYQDVFQREIEQAAVIVEQTFDAIGRTVTLINNPTTVNTVALANRHNLAHAVRGIAERIDREEDVLVLFLSSHGDDDATISVEMGGFRLNDISAADVREIFDENEIKWRVVIVSACYSGSFIDALKSPETLIVTAAAADRSSFGCAHENEWTYFGEAYFGRALKTSRSFVGAFDVARERIAQRETDERKTPSLPQISAGADIVRYLREHDL